MKTLTSKSAANMSSDSVNMSGAEGFFGFAPETNKKKQNKENNTGWVSAHAPGCKTEFSGTCVWFTYSAELKICCRWQRQPGFGLQASNWMNTWQKETKLKIPASHNSAFVTQIKPFFFCFRIDRHPSGLWCNGVKSKMLNSSKLQGSANINVHFLSSNDLQAGQTWYQTTL